MNHAGQVRPGNSSNVADRHPELGETDRLPGLKKGIGFLIAKQSCLDLDIRAVIVRESFAPIQSIGVGTPRPDLFRRKLRVIGKVNRSRVGVWMPNAHERLAASVNKYRNGALGLILNDAQIGAIGFDRPRRNFPETMASRE